MPTSPRHVPFVGRVQEMAELTVALDDALDGRGGLVMLVGEPGIGKTRLAEELEVVARDRGARVVWGASYASGGAPPYWPWTQVIRSLLTEPSEAILTALGPRAAAIAEIVPEIRDVLPDLQPAPEVEPEQARFRLFDSVTSFLGEVAATQPMVVVLDDLHWADQSTLDLLQFVARDISSTSMLLVGGYRDMELSRRHPLSETLAALTRVRAFQRIPLRGLESDDVGRLVEAVGEIRPSRKLVEEIHDRTEGNPFFVAELTRDLSRGAASRGGEFDAMGLRIPEGVREVVGTRLNRLSEECNQVLRTAAVIGREFEFALLTEVSAELSEDALLDAVHEARDASTVRDLPGSGERYEFAHSLIQQTLTDELSVSQRTHLHARIVDAVERLYGDHLDDHCAELAYHCAEAGSAVAADRVVFYARMAGERAAASYAWVEARAYYEQALEALREEAPDAERAAILSGLGWAELFSLTYPDIQRGWDNVAQAFDLYVELGDTQAAVEIAKQTRGYTPIWVNGAADVYSRALEMVAADSVDAGYLLERYASAIRLEREDVEGPQKALEQALGIARRIGDKRLEVRVLVSLSWSRLIEGDYRSVIELGRKTLDLVRETDQPVENGWSRAQTAAALICIGDPDAALMHLEVALSLENQFGFRTVAGGNQYAIALLRGDMAKMGELEKVIDSDHPNDSVIRLKNAIGAWHTEERSDINERFQAAWEESQIAPTLWQRVGNIHYLAWAAYIMDRPRDAIRAGEMARSNLSAPRLAPWNERPARIAAGLAAIAAGDAGEAKEHYQRLENQRGTLIGAGEPFSGDRLLGLLAHAAGMSEEAAARFEDALKFTGKAGYHLETAWTCRDYAEMLLDSDEPASVEKAVSLIVKGLEITNELGLVAIEKRLIGLQKTAASMTAPTPAYPAGLTGREVEVLLLMAKGKTNREIASELVISPRTVQRHTSNIYAKINARNRAEATAFALNELATLIETPPST
ncbi:MAG: AAA family ATPase [Chloroflexi bacterium]|nr:AAA family ATPase [Chloroflexota bacterium]